MNIFIVDESPIESAKYLHDAHVVKMILESAQMLSTAHRILDGKKVVSYLSGRKKTIWELSGSSETVLYKVSHFNHPCNLWVRESSSNYQWLLNHFEALLNEYTFRYERIHKSSQLLDCLRILPVNILQAELTTSVLAMPEKYKSDNPVNSYREYYNFEKLFPRNKPASWKNREIPYWIEKNRLFS